VWLGEQVSDCAREITEYIGGRWRYKRV